MLPIGKSIVIGKYFGRTAFSKETQLGSQIIPMRTRIHDHTGLVWVINTKSQFVVYTLLQMPVFACTTMQCEL